MIKVLMDENLPKSFAEGLDRLQSSLGNSIEVTSIDKEFYRGIKDEEWIPEWGKNSGIFISQDLKIHSTKQQSALLSKYKIGAFFLKAPKRSKYWNRVEIIIRHWEQIVKIIETTKTPYTFIIRPNKVSKA